MFLEIMIPYDVVIEPQHIGKSVFEYVRKVAQEDMLAHCSMGNGKVLAVLDVTIPSLNDVVIGRDSYNGTFTCPTQCRVITQQMYVGETVDMVVKHVSKIGMFGIAGAMIVFVAVSMMPHQYRFDTLPNKMTNGQHNIMPGATLRVRIKGMRQMSNDQYLIASMSGDFLGVIDAPEAEGVVDRDLTTATATATPPNSPPMPQSQPFSPEGTKAVRSKRFKATSARSMPDKQEIQPISNFFDLGT